MKARIEFDGKYYYPYIQKENGDWEPIENYYIDNGLIYSTRNNKCNTLERAEDLVKIATGASIELEKPKAEKNERIIVKEYNL